VTTALPPINENPADPGAVETGSLVTVNNVLFGSAPNASQILLLERGGKQGSWLISTAGDPLVQPGERYILFLHPDARKSIPNSVGIIPDSSVVPRYEVVGYANGKARIDANQKIQFPSGAIPSLLQYNNGDLNTFTAGLKGKIGSMFPTPLPYPSGVTPLSAPPHTIFPSVPSSSKP
jgi:hypothetical protein